ncbi:TPA: glycosyltransferase family 2 protein [Candidatus Micrarchaeota archaeon]|nr:glycosyltransferase family 2 protein [Candidatus Micrarchaeota archaeon]
MGERLSLVAVFYNEAEKLPGYFANVRGVADEIVAVDCSSSDRTAEICRKNGALVIPSKYRYFEQNVNKALSKVNEGGWVLVLDADERLSPGLKREIRKVLESPQTDVYLIKRINYLFDGFSTRSTINTWLPRLFRKGCVHWEQEMPHEKPVVEGKTARLSSIFFHYAYTSVPAYVQKMDEYLCRMPAEYAKKGKNRILIGERDSKVSMIFGSHGLRRMFLYPPILVLNHLIRRRLIFDGRRGAIFAVCAGIYSFFEEAIYYEVKSKEKNSVMINWKKEYPDK